MGPTWGPAGAVRIQVGDMLAAWTLLSETALDFNMISVNQAWDHMYTNCHTWIRFNFFLMSMHGDLDGCLLGIVIVLKGIWNLWYFIWIFYRKWFNRKVTVNINLTAQLQTDAYIWWDESEGCWEAVQSMLTSLMPELENTLHCHICNLFSHKTLPRAWSSVRMVVLSTPQLQF